MVDIESYIQKLTALLQDQFGERLTYVGLQGSYLRGEATGQSDIDIMVIIDGMSVADLDSYRSIIQSLDHADRSCGFICSKEDMRNWNPMEIVHLLHSTRDYFGVLSELVPCCTDLDVRNFVKLSLNNLYHEICHRYIHSGAQRSAEALPAVYKGTFFILQNLHYLRTGHFIGTKAQLLAQLEGADRAVLTRSLELQKGNTYHFQESFTLLFAWCQETLQSL